ncbi:MAG: M56 family metallopeptidase, partial [Candidatus Latescibacterota bacterium]
MITAVICIALDVMGFAIMRGMLSLLWQSSLLFLAAGALVYLFRQRGETVRHLIWVTALLALPLLPLVSRGVAMLGSPRAEIAIIPAYDLPEIVSSWDELQKGSITSQSAEESSDMPAVSGAPSSREITVAPPVFPRHTIFDYPWALALGGYLLIAAILLLWIIVARLRIRKWILDGNPVTETRVIDAFTGAAEQLGLLREYPVITHDRVPAPLTCRILHPVIILPAGFAKTLSESELRAVALHEVAHIQRRDTLILTLISLIRAIFFFQPLVWYAARQASYLAEVSCDTSALEHGGNPTVYAELLTRLAFHLPDRAPSAELAAGILFTNSAFFRRIRVILSDRDGSFRKLSRQAIAGLSLAGFAVLLAVASLPLGEKRAVSGTLSDKAIPNASALHTGREIAATVGNKIDVSISPPGVSASYTVPSVRDGRIIVDGYLSEWGGINAEPVRLFRGSKGSLVRAGRKSPSSPKELSAALTLATDNDFLYVGVAVTDDEQVFDSNSFDMLWERDCLEVLFYGDQKKIRSGQILVTADSDGSLLVGGSDPITGRKYPYIWESLGVKAAIKKTFVGYTIELAVPFSALEFAGWTGNLVRGMNVRVYDKDYQKDRYLVEWSENDSMGWRRLTIAPPAPGHTPYQIRDLSAIRSVLTNIANQQPEEAVKILR